MSSFKIAAVAALTAFALPLAAPAVAQAPAAADTAAAAAFIDKLSNEAFAVLRDKSMSKAAARAKFRGMLQQNVALEEIGGRLIRRQRAQVTPDQYTRYQQALPDFVLNAYTDRLYDYANAKVSVTRTLPRSDTVVDVYSKVAQPGGAPFDAIWQVRKQPGGKFMILNLTVAGINIALTQEADFTSYIGKNGFDALITFMKSANAKAAV